MKEMEKLTLSTREVALIMGNAGIPERFIMVMIDSKAINLEKSTSKGKARIWTQQDIFRVYACKVMFDEFVAKYPRLETKPGFIVQSLRAKLPGLDMGGYTKFTSQEGWRKVTQAAMMMGMNFASSKYAYNPKKA